MTLDTSCPADPRLAFWTAPHLSRLPWLAHGFSWRQGGVSKGPFATLNGGDHVGDTPEAVAENRRRLARAMGFPPEALVCAEQVHGAGVAAVSAGDAGQRFAATDALITDAPGLLLTLFFADCLPVFLVAPEQRAIAIAHAGWRGAAAGVVASTVNALRDRGIPPSRLLAAVGPGIGPCCFEVGEEVAAVFPEETMRSPEKPRPCIDLAAAVVRQLQEADIPPEQIHRSNDCTFCLPDRYFSHRRDRGRTGRMAAVAGIRAG